MGGHEGGQVASRIAVETVKQSYSQSRETDAQRALAHAFAEAHQQIQLRAVEQPSLKGMGTTCTAFALVNDRLYFAHIGDSRLYLLQSGALRLLSHDHTLIARWVQSGVIKPEEAEHHPQKHVLTAAMGVAGEINPDVPAGPVSVRQADTLMICTDGLWGQMSEAEIHAVLGKESPENACREFVRLARERGGPDNITVLVLRIGGGARPRLA
jgi:protein phosphatase